MKLLILSLLFLAVFFGVPGCISANKPKLPLLFIGEQSISKARNLESNYSLSNIKISNSNYLRIDESFKYNEDFTYDCAKNNLYILKSIDNTVAKRVLDVLHYNKKGKLLIINSVPEMFDNATSISIDWKKGKIYWVVRNRSYFSIKVTDRTFKNSNYVILPEQTYIKKIQVYPKQKQIFFSNGTHIFYTSNSPNSTAKLLFDSSVKLEGLENFVIDYATDKLCWIADLKSWDALRCVDISRLSQPLNSEDIVIVEEDLLLRNTDLVAYNNTFYWTEIYLENSLRLFTKKNNESYADVTVLPEEKRLLFIYPNCPATAAKNN
ncbi:uncharacterized protein LOC122853494 [Aphidius gifuensis]|uniref:uncharacterized protein LOC122853494 n=1 Tax=Aphidius gifuensis TaxID=684658 RepID=UPI001CDC34A2|nr:uncharacterized protein LOC122853494 [Aphidius gifuensis]